LVKKKRVKRKPTFGTEQMLDFLMRKNRSGRGRTEQYSRCGQIRETKFEENRRETVGIKTTKEETTTFSRFTANRLNMRRPGKITRDSEAKYLYEKSSSRGAIEIKRGERR